MNLDDNEAAAHLQALAATTSDAFVTIDAKSRIQYVNQPIESILGYAPDELQGEPLTVLMPDEFGDRHLEAMDRYLETGTRRLDWNHVELPGQHRDGHRVPLQISFSEFTLDGDRYITGVLRDVSERRTLEAERELLHATRERLLETETFFEGLTNALALVGQSTDWVYGEAWVTNRDDDLIERRATWSEDESVPGTSEDESADGSRGESAGPPTFARGEGLVGRVWESGEFEWVPDVSMVEGTEFARSEAAFEAGLKAALAVPVTAGETVDAVLLFLMPEEQVVDEQLVEVTRTVAATLGLMLDRQQVEASLYRERDLVSNILATTPIAIVVVDANGDVTYANDQAESLLETGPVEAVVRPSAGEHDVRPLDADGEPIPEAEYPYRYVLETGDDVSRELQIESPDGSVQWLAVDGSPLEDDDGVVTSTVFALRDVTEQRRQTRRLERLNGLGRALSDVETFQEGCERAVAVASEIFDVSVTAIDLYDSETGALEPTARSSSVEELAGDVPLFDDAHDLAWDAFVENEPRVYSNVEAETDLTSEDTPLSSVAVFPIDGHGVLVCGATEPGGFDESTIALTAILVQNVASAFERLDREVSLRERTADVEAKNEQLERVQRVNQQIRDITRSLLDAEGSGEIKQVVCDRLAESEPYRFVWFGERDFATDEIEPVAWAGVEDGYLDAVTVTADSSETGQGPAGRAFRTHEPQAQNDLQADPPFEPWRQEALQREYRSSISVPVAYNDSVYGLLNLYANEPGVFSEMEEGVLSELGEMVGFALNARERYDALVSEESVELQFSIRDDDYPLLDFLAEHDAAFTLKNVSRSTETGIVVVAAFEGASSEAVRAFGERYAVVSNQSVIRERDGETIVEASLRPGSFLVRLLDRGAVPTNFRATSEEGLVTIRTSKAASPREFVELFADRFDAVELVARREVDDPVRSSEGLAQAYLDQLTERQEEVLRTAFYAGFFEQPRASSARDVADLLDVSQPTVSRHIRTAEETLFSLLFGDTGTR